MKSRRVGSSPGVASNDNPEAPASTSTCRPPAAVTTSRSALAASGTPTLTPCSRPSSYRTEKSVSDDSAFEPSSTCATVPRRPEPSRSASPAAASSRAAAHVESSGVGAHA